MTDIETLGNSSCSVIIAIGAVKFTIPGGVTDRFYTTVSAKSCVDAGLKMDADTVLWWMQQSQEARAQFKEANQPSLYDALRKFTAWIGDAPPKGVWGNGVAFDNVILDNAYKALKLERPWPFWADMCYRTIKNLYPNIKMDRIVGVHHNALSDAENQAVHLLKILSSR